MALVLPDYYAIFRLALLKLAFCYAIVTRILQADDQSGAEIRASSERRNPFVVIRNFPIPVGILYKAALVIEDVVCRQTKRDFVVDLLLFIFESLIGEEDLKKIRFLILGDARFCIFLY